MATISTLYKSGTAHQADSVSRAKRPYVIDNFIDWAEAATDKGSALAAADVVEALQVPAGSYVLFAGLQVVDVATGESADVTLDLGVTGVDADQWVDGFDLDAAAADAYAAPPAFLTTAPERFFSAADTIDVLIATATTAPTGGVIRVWAVITDVANKPVGPAGIAQVGS